MNSNGDGQITHSVHVRWYAFVSERILLVLTGFKDALSNGSIPLPIMAYRYNRLPGWTKSAIPIQAFSELWPTVAQQDG
jgi:hypothetical protein